MKNISPNAINLEDMKMLFSGIGKHLSKLKKLRLDFYRYRKNNSEDFMCISVGLKIETINFIARQISKNFKGLQEVTLDIHRYFRIQGKVLKELLERR